MIHFVIPGRLDQPTGGYRYDARIIAGLRALGRELRLHELPGRFPEPDAIAIDAAARLVEALAWDDLCVIDGLALPAFYDRLQEIGPRVIALVHHPLGLETGLTRAASRRWLMREAAALAKPRGIIVTSAQTRRDLLAMAVQQPIVVINPGTARSNARARQARPPMLLTVASLTPRKGHADALRALAGLRSLRWRWSCAGDAARGSGQARRLRALIRAFGLGRRVTLLGALPHERLARLYARAALFLLPSRHEGYGMAFAEALEAGLPCIGYRAGAVPDLVPRSAGRLLRVGDTAGLRHAIRRTLRNRAAFAAGARRAGKRLPDWDDAARGFAAAIDRLCATESFSADWLALRAPHDARARSADLARRFAEMLPRNACVIDLACGTGANARYLSGHGATWSWRLVDHDHDLLERAAALAGSSQIAVRNLRADWEDVLDQAHGVTSAAFVDLVSPQWIEGLFAALAARRLPALIALSVDGRHEIAPADQDDAAVFAAFARDQRRDKGFGPAAGSDAPALLLSAARQVGYATETAASDWRIDAGDQAMLTAMIAGIAEAAMRASPKQTARITRWRARRMAQIGAGALTLMVGHQDLFAWPGGSSTA